MNTIYKDDKMEIKTAKSDIWPVVIDDDIKLIVSYSWMESFVMLMDDFATSCFFCFFFLQFLLLWVMIYSV